MMNKPILLMGALLASTSVELSAQKNRENPNIVFVLADDMGIGDLGCYGQKKIKTPNIDQLAEKGLLFTNHYSGSTVSAPSRCCLLKELNRKKGSLIYIYLKKKLPWQRF